MVKTTGTPASVVNCPFRPAGLMNAIEARGSDGTSLPKLTTARPVVSVGLSVESVSAGRLLSTLAPFRPSSSTTVFVADSTSGIELEGP